MKITKKYIEIRFLSNISTKIYTLCKLICLTKYTFLNNGNPSMTIPFGDMVTLHRVALELNYMDSL